MAVAHPKTTLLEEVLTFMATFPTPQEVIDYQVSDVLDERLHELLDKNAASRLTDDEQAELDDFLRMNRYIMQLKLKARKKLAE